MLMVNSCWMRIARAFIELIKCWISNNWILVFLELFLLFSRSFLLSLSVFFSTGWKVPTSQNWIRMSEKNSNVHPDRSMCGVHSIHGNCEMHCIRWISLLFHSNTKRIVVCLTVDIISTFASFSLSPRFKRK